MEKVDLLTGSVAQLQDNYIKLESDVEDKTAKLWEECRRLSREHSVSTSTAVGTLKTEVTERIRDSVDALPTRCDFKGVSDKVVATEKAIAEQRQVFSLAVDAAEERAQAAVAEARSVQESVRKIGADLAAHIASCSSTNSEVQVARSRLDDLELRLNCDVGSLTETQGLCSDPCEALSEGRRCHMEMLEAKLDLITQQVSYVQDTARESSQIQFDELEKSFHSFQDSALEHVRSSASSIERKLLHQLASQEAELRSWISHRLEDDAARRRQEAGEVGCLVGAFERQFSVQLTEVRESCRAEQQAHAQALGLSVKHFETRVAREVESISNKAQQTTTALSRLEHRIEDRLSCMSARSNDISTDLAEAIERRATSQSNLFGRAMLQLEERIDRRHGERFQEVVKAVEGTLESSQRSSRDGVREFADHAVQQRRVLEDLGCRLASEQAKSDRYDGRLQDNGKQVIRLWEEIGQLYSLIAPQKKIENFFEGSRKGGVSPTLVCSVRVCSPRADDAIIRDVSSSPR